MIYGCKAPALQIQIIERSLNFILFQAPFVVTSIRLSTVQCSPVENKELADAHKHTCVVGVGRCLRDNKTRHPDNVGVLILGAFNRLRAPQQGRLRGQTRTIR